MSPGTAYTSILTVAFVTSAGMEATQIPLGDEEITVLSIHTMEYYLPLKRGILMPVIILMNLEDIAE